MSRSARRRAAPGGPPSGERVVAGAGGVVFDPGGRVLVIRHRNGSWVFPKGHIEQGETATDAAVREVEEEAGVDATCPDPARSWTTRYHNPRGELRRITWFALRTDATAPVLREALFPDGAFLAPDDALGRLTFEEDRSLLRSVLADATGSPG